MEADAGEDVTNMRSIIQRIATGPKLSKDISREETQAGMRSILEGSVDPVQAAIFLIALRMKRETDDENRGVLDAIRAATRTVVAPVETLLDIADPYNGYTRSLPASPFLPAVLAACGIPTVSHGLESVGPKYGITHHTVLRAAGVAVDSSPEKVAEQTGNPEIGWGYIDQSRFCAPLHELVSLRTLMVKRSVITTVEVLTGPLRGRGKTCLMTGYVHKPYPRLYALLARQSGFDSALLVRGVEGGVIPSLRQTGKIWQYHQMEEERDTTIEPAEFGIDQPLRAVALPDDLPAVAGEPDRIGMTVDVPIASETAAAAGLEALDGKAGATRDSLVFGAALGLHHVHPDQSFSRAAETVREVLDSGAALRRFRAG